MPRPMPFPRTLVQRLQAGKLIPFVGAGVSAGVLRRGTDTRLFPTWRELLLSAGERLRAEQKSAHANVVDNLVELGRPEDYLQAAKHACDGLGPTWYDFLREQF